tara:strand:- start:467 stop:991 length:525 start_codon:yes stop_codon:yes gene_type:complete
MITLILLVFNFNYKDFIVEYSYRNPLILYIISTLLILSYIVSLRFILENKFNRFNLVNFFYGLAIPQYFLISFLFNFGILGNPNFKTKLFLRDEAVSSIINSNTIYLFGVDSKTETLLLYYLPSSQVISNINDISNYKYLITSDFKILRNPNIKSVFRSIKKIDNQLLLMNMSK